jgi:hypothetical protein
MLSAIGDPLDERIEADVRRSCHSIGAELIMPSPGDSSVPSGACCRVEAIMLRFLPALGGAVMLIGCGGGGPTSLSSAGGQSTPSAATSAATGGGSGGALVVTGSLSLSLQESSNSASACQFNPGANQVTGILVFNGYALQFGIAVGTTHYPMTPPSSAVAFFNGNDSHQEWSVGTPRSATASGTVTLSADHKTGTVDVDMLPDAPRPNPALKPVHVKGTFTCP